MALASAEQAAAALQPEGNAACDAAAGCQVVKFQQQQEVCWLGKPAERSLLRSKHPSNSDRSGCSSDWDEGDSCGDSTVFVHSSGPSSPDATGEEPAESSSTGEEDSKHEGSQGQQQQAAPPAPHVPTSSDATKIKQRGPIALPPGYPHAALLAPGQTWGVPAFVPFYPSQPLQQRQPVRSSQQSSSLPSHASTQGTDATGCPDSPCSSKQHDRHMSSSSSTTSSSWSEGSRSRPGKGAHASPAPVPSTHHPPPAVAMPPEQHPHAQHRSSRVKFAPSSRVSTAPPPGSSRISSGPPGSASFTATGLVHKTSLHSRVSLGSSGPLLTSSSGSSKPPLAPVSGSSSRCVTPSPQSLVPALAPADPHPLVKQATAGDLPAHSGCALSSSRSSGSLSSLASRSSVPLHTTGTTHTSCTVDSACVPSSQHHSQAPPAQPHTMYSRSNSSALLSPTPTASSSYSNLTALCSSEHAAGASAALDQAPRSCFAPLLLRVAGSPTPPSAFATPSAASRVCSPTPPPACPSPPLDTAAAPLPIAPPPPPSAPRASRAVLPTQSCSTSVSSGSAPTAASPAFATLPTALHAAPPPRPRVVPAPTSPAFPPRPIRTTAPPDSSAQQRTHGALSPGMSAALSAYPTPHAGGHSRVSLPRHHSSCSQPDLHRLAHAPELAQTPPSRVASFTSVTPLSVPGSPTCAGGGPRSFNPAAACCPPLPRQPRVQRQDQAGGCV